MYINDWLIVARNTEKVKREGVDHVQSLPTARVEGQLSKIRVDANSGFCVSGLSLQASQQHGLSPEQEGGRPESCDRRNVVKFPITGGSGESS